MTAIMFAREIHAIAPTCRRRRATRRLAVGAPRPIRIRTGSVPLLDRDPSVMIAAREAS
jgi:hypothetical protein